MAAIVVVMSAIFQEAIITEVDGDARSEHAASAHRSQTNHFAESVSVRAKHHRQHFDGGRTSGVERRRLGWSLGRASDVRAERSDHYTIEECNFKFLF